MADKFTAQAFLQLVQQSGLVPKASLDAQWDEFSSKGSADPKGFAELLRESNLLTRWQVDKLLQGKHKGFFLGKYKLLSHLGSGGMSSVYLAEHIVMKRRVAVKVLPSSRIEDSSYLERFHREAQAVASLDHTNIVRAYDVDKEGKIHFLVMEYVEGQNLQEMVQRQGPLDVTWAVEYIRQAAEGLSHAHQAGMVHRDVKPGNLLVDLRGAVKLLDLGLAMFYHSTEQSLTVRHDEKVLGTADYLSPEQALDSHTVDTRADIYSLGCTLFFLLTGRPPFQAGTLAQRLLAHQTKEPESIENIRPTVPSSLCDIIRKMMSKSPDNRFQTMAETARALLRWLLENGNTNWQRKFSQLPDAANATGFVLDSSDSTKPFPDPSDTTKVPLVTRKESDPIPIHIGNQEGGNKFPSEGTTNKFATEGPTNQSAAQGNLPGTFLTELSNIEISGKPGSNRTHETDSKTSIPQTTTISQPSSGVFDEPELGAFLNKLGSSQILKEVPGKGNREQSPAKGNREQAREPKSNPVPVQEPSSNPNDFAGLGKSPSNSARSAPAPMAGTSSPVRGRQMGPLGWGLLVLSLALGGLSAWWIVSYAWPRSEEVVEEKKKGDEEEGSEEPPPGKVLQREVLVGFGGHPTLAAALADVRKHAREMATTRRALQTIKILGGQVLKERLVLDKTFPQQVEIVADPPATLAPGGASPIIDIAGVSRLRISGLKVLAEGCETAIRIRDFCENLRLEEMEIEAYSKTGLEAVGAFSFSNVPISIRKVVFKPNHPEAVGILIKKGENLTSQLTVSESRFWGPMTAGVVSDGESQYLSFRQNIFDQTTTGIRFVGAHPFKQLEFTNNTFHQIDSGIIFSEMPLSGASGISILHNMFSEPKAAEVLVEKDFDSVKFYSMLNLEGLGNNLSSRPAPTNAEEAIKRGEVPIFGRAGLQGIKDFQFSNTDPNDPRFLAPGDTSPQRMRPVIGSGLPFVGAVAP